MPSTTDLEPSDPTNDSPTKTSRQSHTFSRSYGANLPTSLTYIKSKELEVLKPWRPDADMGTAMHENYTHSLGGFQGPNRLGSGHFRYGSSFRHQPPILELNSFLGF